ncbi:MAG: glycosyltransferase family 87 protein [Pseudomonadota bacterium]
MSATDRLFTPRLAFLAVLAIAASQYLVFVMALFGVSPEFTFGGDFVAFWAAAKETLNGDMTALYAPLGLEQAIQTHSPHDALEGLTWQYPPHAGLVFSPLGLLPFPIAYAVWCGLGLSVYAMALHAVGLKDRFLFVALASVPVLLALKTGQNALFMGALLIVAVFYARSKPLVAGLAAAVLTLKPQLGFLLPVLFLAGGHWRAFAYASIGSLGLFGLSMGVFGISAWMTFLDSVLAVSGSVATGEMPIFKMVNLYAAVQLAGVPDAAAMTLAGLAILMAMVAMFWVARVTEDPVWRYAALASLTLIAAPYSYYYELALIVPALLFIVKRGYEAGWLRFEREMVASALLLSLAVPGLPIRSGLSISFVLMAVIAVIIARRLRAELAPKPSASLRLA